MADIRTRVEVKAPHYKIEGAPDWDVNENLRKFINVIDYDCIKHTKVPYQGQQLYNKLTKNEWANQLI